MSSCLVVAGASGRELARSGVMTMGFNRRANSLHSIGVGLPGSSDRSGSGGGTGAPLAPGLAAVLPATLPAGTAAAAAAAAATSSGVGSGMLSACAPVYVGVVLRSCLVRGSLALCSPQGVLTTRRIGLF